MRGLAAVSLVLAASCTPSLSPVPDAWRTVPQAAKITDLCARVTCAERPKATDVRVSGGALYRGEKNLTPPFEAIQSFDVSAERGEVVFSAKRESLDIGLVSTDGSQINWFPAERADETDVQWAPRGNKASYIVHTPRGDVVRTLHVPTSAQLSVEFLNSRIDALAWDPPAERYAVVVESPVASQHVESTKYGGEERRTVVPAAATLGVSLEPFAGAILLRPASMKYNEKLPLVVWSDPEPLRWSDERAALLRDARVALAVVSKAPDQAFWNEVGKTKWIDANRVYAVNWRFSGARSIVEDAAVPAGFYRVQGTEVRVAKVQSFAAGYIAHELSTNGLR